MLGLTKFNIRCSDSLGSSNKRFVFFLLDIAAPAAAAWKTKNLNLRYLFSFSEFRVQVSSSLSLDHTAFL
ncbi:hypothetical protein L2E82_20991 [Cichorium intybus]|uniref:Uncharacterized protein n=1 Tax=Cichorium intybus TaxID=13427 RepID=A0ACB9DVS0_CICIN|nr:hypothetical protein L2E82_20991 [Cichorium intybus]